MTIRREDLKDLYPLTPMQEGMLFHARHEPDSPAYTEQVVWRVSGAFDVEKYQAAWDALHARHDFETAVKIMHAGHAAALLAQQRARTPSAGRAQPTQAGFHQPHHAPPRPPDGKLRRGREPVSRRRHHDVHRRLAVAGNGDARHARGLVRRMLAQRPVDP